MPNPRVVAAVVELRLADGSTVRYNIKDPQACAVRARGLQKVTDENYDRPVNGTPTQISFAFGWRAAGNRG